MVYDVLVIGGGPAGITSAIYVKRANKSVAIFEKFAVGGQINMLAKVDNYLGFSGVEGAELAQSFSAHAKNLQIPFIYEEAKDYDLSGEIKKVITRKSVYEAKSVIFALGSHTIPLGIANEEKFKGRGVSYCAVCDGNFFKGLKVAVVGSGSSALGDAQYLSGVCDKVYLLTESVLENKQVLDFKNVEVLENTKVSEIIGENAVKGLKYIKDNQEHSIALDGIFIAVGRMPDTENLIGKLELNSQGYIKTNQLMHTSVEGVFACGDVREGSLKQISVATGDGAVAGTEAVKFVSLLNYKKSSK